MENQELIIKDFNAQTATDEELRAYRARLAGNTLSPLIHECSKCNAKIGEVCKSSAGKETGFHATRDDIFRKSKLLHDISAEMNRIATEINDRLIKKQEEQRTKEKEEQKKVAIQENEEQYKKIIKYCSKSKKNRPTIVLCPTETYDSGHSVTGYKVVCVKNSLFPLPGKILRDALVERLIESKKIDIIFEERNAGNNSRYELIWPGWRQ